MEIVAVRHSVSWVEAKDFSDVPVSDARASLFSCWFRIYAVSGKVKIAKSNTNPIRTDATWYIVLQVWFIVISLQVRVSSCIVRWFRSSGDSYPDTNMPPDTPADKKAV